MKKIFALIVLLGFSFEVYCQIPPTDGTPQESPWVENNGFLLKTQVSATSVYTGVTYSYTIFYTIPPGVDPGTVINISDLIPAPLKVETTSDPNMSISPIDDDITTPTNIIYTVPAGNKVQGTYNFQVNVKFPPGTTCNGTIADNFACMTTTGTTGPQISLPNPGLCTASVSMLAVAIDNPYNINKSCVLQYTGSDSNPLYQGVVDGDIEYCVTVGWKAGSFYSDGYGLQDLINVMVTDVLPNGAIFVPGSFRITYGNPYQNSAIIASVTQTGNILSFVIPSVVYNQWLWAFYYKIHFPGSLFPAGTIVNNSVSYTATSCNTTVNSNTATAQVQLNEAVYSAGNHGKSAVINNPVPGCIGYYYLAVQNTGNSPFPAFTMMDDPFPSDLHVDKIVFNTYYWGSYPLPLTLNINNGALVVNAPLTNQYTWYNSTNIDVSSIKVDLGSGLSVLGVYAFSIYFTIGDNLLPGDVISNDMDITFDPLYNMPDLHATNSFIIEDFKPWACYRAKVCNQLDAYLYGDVIRFKFAIQNIGSEPITGAKVTDILSSNFEYIPGSETYYSTMNYNHNCGSNDPTPPDLPPPPIPAGASPWTGVSVVQNGQTIEWLLPPIEPNCELANFYYACGDPSYYYYIEFNVRVKQYALAGSVPNFFTVSGGNLIGSGNTGTNYITVNSVYGAQAEKFISVDDGATWGKTVSAVPGSEVMFRLQYKNTANYPVKDIVFVDMLPRNYSITDDRMILNRNNPNNRGSHFDLYYSTTLNSPSGTLPLAKINSAPIINSPTVSVNNDPNICLPELNYSPPGCFNNPAWTASGFDKNVKFEFGPNTSLQPGEILTCDFKVTLPADTPENLMACNSFALNSTGYYYIINQSGASVLHIVDPLPTESDLGCLIAGAFTASAEPISLYNGYNISCYGGNNGSAEAFPGGGLPSYTYLWDDPAAQTTKIATNLVAGTYTVIITDAVGNNATASCTLTQPPPLYIDAGADQTVYFGYVPSQCTTLSWSNESGGVPPYNMSWNTGETTQSILVCPASTTLYTVTIMDANNCVYSDQVEVCVMDIRCGNGNNYGHKVYICHNTGSQSNPYVTICVDTNAVAAHLAEHGDALGPCGAVCEGLKIGIAGNDEVDFEEGINLQAYPNPFSEEVTITFKCLDEGRVTLKLIDHAGRIQTTIYEGKAEKGLTYHFNLDGNKLSKGLYFLVLQHADGTMKRMKIINM